MRLTLFQRDHCPLCDQAYELLASAGIPDFEPVWIDADEGLEARFGARVPVLRREADGAELDWPFSLTSLQAFLQVPPTTAGS
ncbi:MAG: glutaredoxin family protein [Arenimonas sp.]